MIMLAVLSTLNDRSTAASVETYPDAKVPVNNGNIYDAGLLLAGWWAVDGYVKCVK